MPTPPQAVRQLKFHQFTHDWYICTYIYISPLMPSPRRQIYLTMKDALWHRSMFFWSMRLQPKQKEKPLHHVADTLGTLWISSYRLFKLRVSLRSAVPGVSLWVSAVPMPTSAGDAGMANGDSFSAIADFRGGTMSGLHFSTRVLGNHSSNRLLSAAAKIEVTSLQLLNVIPYLSD